MIDSDGRNSDKASDLPCQREGKIREETMNRLADRLPLLNLSALGQKMNALSRFLSDSIDRRDSIDDDQIRMVSSTIASAVQEIIVNGAALVASSQVLNPSLSTGASQPCNPSSTVRDADMVDRSSQPVPTPRFPHTRSGNPRSSVPVGCSDPPSSDQAAEDGEDCDIVEIDTAEILAEHAHLCEICGKGFKRDANLRMHMRAHGDRYKTLEALSKPDPEFCVSSGREATTGRRILFSCPHSGCNRNRAHKKFRPLKSVACVKNHFKRSHCPKMYSCYRCNKKSFSVVADLKSHLKHCGESRWRCSCGTTFSRKDKLFGHVALFDGHMPVVEVGVKDELKKEDVILEEDEEEVEVSGVADNAGEGFDPEFFKGLMEDFDDMEREHLKSLL
ncbi:protein SENSITIVE TO PROTON RHIZOTOXICITY 1-like [Zingiber officinale]|uniref:C2H2-type domain-containing protein n=1 Tax=Zingiber officinale TaxID=94328 RepID=A0A8J5KZA9_ZINOF|nr:protein SENSITIVE TO PROTON RHIZOTOXICITY 1-like [Zingiber officinale]KAG6498522.1 hypothetical protein ZIOFF_038242 [Zingiber officinale]